MRKGPRLGFATNLGVLGVAAALLALTNLQVATGYHPGTYGPLPGLLSALVTPCLLLLPLLRRTFQPRTAALAAVPMNVLALMVLSLVVDGVLQLFGNQRPLSPGPLVVCLDVYVVLLLVVGLLWSARWRHSYEPLRGRWPAGRPSWRSGLTLALVALGVLCAVTGAVRLNNGSGPEVGIAALVFLCAAVICLLVFAPRLGTDVSTVAVYGIAVALLLRSSMRGWLISGPDSQGEYYVYLHVAMTHMWQPGGGNASYNSCLSITLLPQFLSSVSGISGVFLWKAVLPLLFAVTPVLVVAIGRGVLGRRRALLGAIAYMAFPAFIYSVAFAARQEIAFLFVGLATFVLFGRMTRGRRIVLLLSVIGVILSHYSTSYYLVAMLIAAKLLSVVLSPRFISAVTRPAPSIGRRVLDLVPRAPAARRTLGGTGPFSIVLIVFCLVGIGVWDGAVNQITGDVASVAQNRLPKNVEGAPLSTLNGPRPSAVRVVGSSSLRSFADTEQGTIAPGSGYPTEQLDQFTVRSASILDEPPTALGRAMNGVGISPSQVNSDLRSAISVGFQVLSLLGVIGFALRRRWRDWQFFLFGAANGVLALAINVVPVLTTSYGAGRAFQQGLTVLGPCIALGLSGSLRRARVPRSELVTGAVTLVGFGSLCGLIPQATGGYVAQVDFNRLGAYPENYLTSPQEMAAVGWANANLEGRTLQMNSNVQRRLQAYISDPVINDDFPDVLRPAAILFLGTETSRTGVDTTQGTLAYAYPGQLLYELKSRIYANPGAGMYG